MISIGERFSLREVCLLPGPRYSLSLLFPAISQSIDFLSRRRCRTTVNRSLLAEIVWAGKRCAWGDHAAVYCISLGPKSDPDLWLLINRQS